MKPDFICIGAQKAGTSWLYEMLSQHPECSLPPVKELHYFDRSRDYPSPNLLSETKLIGRLKDRNFLLDCTRKIITSLREEDLKRARWWARFHLANYSDPWYLSLFKSESGITGDITPAYSILKAADVKRMKETVPEAKIIFLIRNPIERVWSMLRFHADVQGKKVDLDDFDEFRREVESEGQVLRSDYLRTIDLFAEYYHADRFLIGFYDAIQANPAGLLSAIQKHIGCTNISMPDNINSRVHPSQAAGLPDHYRGYLKEKYMQDICELARRYGSYARRWQLELNGDGKEQTEEAFDLEPVVHP